MTKAPSDKRPTFASVKTELQRHGFKLVRERIFPNDDLEINVFRGTSADGRAVFAHVPDYEDDERIEPEVTGNICRGLGLAPDAIEIDCGDGHRVSMNPLPPDDDSGADGASGAGVIN